MSVDTAFIKGKNTRHYDLKVSLSYNVAGQKTYVANHLYEFEEKKNAYILVKKDDPPKFMQPAAPSAIAAATPELPASTVSPSNAVAGPAPTFGACNGFTDCVARMLVAAKANDVLAASNAAATISALPKPARGDRVKARKLNEEGLAALRANNSTEGVRLFAEAGMVDPGNEEVQSNLAYAYSLAGNYTQAVSAANTALAINPRRTSVWAPLAMTFTKMHDRPHALAAMWLAYQFSADKQKTMDFLNTRLGAETNPELRQLYADSIGWFAQNKMPAGL